MEKRIALVTVLSFVVLVVWFWFIAPRFAPPKPRPKPRPTADEEPSWADVRKPAPAPTVGPSAQPREEIVIEGAGLRATLTNRGAGLRQLEVNYKDKWVTLLTPSDARAHMVMAFADEPEMETAFWDVKEESATAVTFVRKTRGGVSVERAYAIDAERGLITAKVFFTNTAGGEQRLKLELHAFAGMPHDSDYRVEQYARAYAGVRTGGSGHKLEFTAASEVEKEPKRRPASKLDKGQTFDAVGIQNRYFAVALLQESDGTRQQVDAVVFTRHPGKPPHLRASIALADLTVREKQQLEYAIFAGPFEDALLQKVGHGLPELHDYSTCSPLAWITRPIAGLLLMVMNFWSWAFGNFGVAIMLTTLCLRLCLFPLSRKSAISMAKMGELGPKMTLIRERYADNPQKAQAETMKMWKEHGVNPISGCLPIFLQLPIWIGMYSVVDMAIEFRQAPFLFWIKDLSQPDRLVHFGGGVNLLFTTLTDLNLLPVIMTVTWFLQAYYAPRSPDPQMAMQQKMFLFMPIVFGLMCYTLASGLSLYFFVNSLLSMAEQKIIKKIWIKPAPGTSPPPAKPAAP